MRNSENYSKDFLDFQFQDVWIISLAHAKGIFKIIFGHKYFISEPIFQNFAALFFTFGLQKDGMFIFFLRCFRNVRF